MMEVAPKAPDGTEMSRADWERIRELGRNDLYFFARGILKYNLLTINTHREACDFYMNEELPRKLILMPRGHLKTTINMSDALRRVVRNPNIRILIANESSENAKAMLSLIKQHFTGNPTFRMFYPEIIPPDFAKTIWASDKIRVPRTAAWPEETIEAFGITSSIVSRHYDLIKVDDLIAEEAFKSPSVMEYARGWLKRLVSLLIPPIHKKEIQLTGTHWSYGDAYSTALEMGYTAFKRKAVVEDPVTGEIVPFFPEQFSMQQFADIIQGDPDQWATQYANDPLDVDTADLRPSWMRFYEWRADRTIRYVTPDGATHFVDPQKLAIYTHVDPSVGDSPSSDYSGVVTVGVAPDGRVFVLDAWRRRLDPLLLIEKLFEVASTWQPKKLSIEKVGYQKALRFYMEAEAKKRRTHIRLVDWPPTGSALLKKNKVARILGALQPYFSTGLIYFNSSQVDLIEEYRSFRRSDRDDILDALSQGPTYWKAPLDDVGLRHHTALRQKFLAGAGNLGVTGYGF